MKIHVRPGHIELLARVVRRNPLHIVEWPEVAEAALPAAKARVRLEHLGGDRRRLLVE